jgi:glucose/mannose-6-phosphate isomerase
MPALDRAAIEAADPSGQLAEVLDLPIHLRDALWRVDSAGLAPRRSAGLVVAGMGGSGVGGLLARGALAGRETRPVLCVRDAGLPAWVDETWSVLLSSYSGSTEETLACWDAATERGCHRIACTTGGPLADRAREAGVAVVPVPGGFQPRAAVGYSAVVALEVAAAAGVAPSLRDEVEAAAVLLDGLVAEWGPDAPEDAESKALAAALDGRVPVVVGGGVTTPVAYRWKSQVNENANRHAFASQLPEADHNEIEAWGGPGPFAAVMLEDPAGDARLRRRFELTAEVVGGAHRVQARGDTPAERVFSLVLLGDLVSLYLAVLAGVDPEAVPAIERFKQQLERG